MVALWQDLVSQLQDTSCKQQIQWLRSDAANASVLQSLDKQACTLCVNMSLHAD